MPDSTVKNDDGFTYSTIPFCTKYIQWYLNPIERSNFTNNNKYVKNCTFYYFHLQQNQLGQGLPMQLIKSGVKTLVQKPGAHNIFRLSMYYLSKP